MKRFAFFLIIAMLTMITQTNAEPRAENTKINWLTIEEAEKLALENPKAIFIDVYTDWCGWCRRMEANTFSHPQIIEYINENFYPVKLNAEMAEPVTFLGTQYVNENPGARRSSHDFARFILNGRMGYPTIVFLIEDMTQIAPIPGYREPSQLEPVLVYFADKHYRSGINLQDFINNFDGKIE